MNPTIIELLKNKRGNKSEAFIVGQRVRIVTGDFSGAYGQIVGLPPYPLAPYAVWLFSGISGGIYGVHGPRMIKSANGLTIWPKFPDLCTQ